MALNYSIVQALAYLSVTTLEKLALLFPDNAQLIHEFIKEKNQLDEKIAVVTALWVEKLPKESLESTLTDTASYALKIDMEDQASDAAVRARERHRRFPDTIAEYARAHNLECKEVLSWPWSRIAEELEDLQSQSTPKAITESVLKIPKTEYTESVENFGGRVFILQSSDEHKYELDAAKAMESVYYWKTVVERGNTHAMVPFTSLVLDSVFRYLNSELEIQTLDQYQILDLHRAADFLQIEKILDVTNQKIAELIEGKSMSEINAANDNLNQWVPDVS